MKIEGSMILPTYPGKIPIDIPKHPKPPLLDVYGPSFLGSTSDAGCQLFQTTSSFCQVLKVGCDSVVQCSPIGVLDHAEMWFFKEWMGFKTAMRG